MIYRILALVALAGCLWPSMAQAQQAQAEIVVPQFNFFGVNTTIVAPDRGGASMGGVNRAADVRNEFGFFPRDRGISSSRTASGSNVRVWITDFNEMEEELARRSGQASAAASRRGFSGSLRRYAATPSSSDKAPASDAKLADTKSAAEDEATSKESHAANLLKRGQEAEANGKAKVAILYYKSVASLEGTSSAKIARVRLRELELKLAGR